MGWSRFEEQEAKSKIKLVGRRKFMNESRNCKLQEESIRLGIFRSGWNRSTRYLDRKYSSTILTDPNLKDGKQRNHKVYRENKEGSTRILITGMEDKSTLNLYRLKKYTARFFL